MINYKHASPAGQLSAQRVLLEVRRWGKRSAESVSSFTEELLVRRELSDNFCFYNDNYDNINGQYTLPKECKEAWPRCLR